MNKFHALVSDFYNSKQPTTNTPYTHQQQNTTEEANNKQQERSKKEKGIDMALWEGGLFE